MRFVFLQPTSVAQAEMSVTARNNPDICRSHVASLSSIGRGRGLVNVLRLRHGRLEVGVG